MIRANMTRARFEKGYGFEMPLHLAIENEPSLPDGGPIAVTVTRRRGIDIGRDQYLDWVLPDPSRFISGKHCEIRHKDGGYWVTDVSTNGTFVNGNEFRLDGAHRLQSGDRIEIGRYIIAVTVEPDTDEPAPPVAEVRGAGQDTASLWMVGDEAAPAINPRELRTPIVSSGIGTFNALDWASDIPAIHTPIEPQHGSEGPDKADRGSNWTVEASIPPTNLRPLDGKVPEDMPPEAMPPEDRPVEDRPVEDRPVEDKSFAVAGPSRERPDMQELPDLPSSEDAGATAVATDLPYMETRAPDARDTPFPIYPGAETKPRKTDFVERFAKGLGVSKDAIVIEDESEFAELLGRLILSSVENMRQLNLARVQAKGMMRSSNQTMIQATENNPLRFTPTSEDAVRILFGPKTSSYMHPLKAFDSSFADLKKHQLAFFSAMQQAATKLLEDFDPKTIEALIDKKGGGGLLNSKKGKMWEHFQTTWQAKCGQKETGMLAVFMLLFADAYDRTP